MCELPGACVMCVRSVSPRPASRQAPLQCPDELGLGERLHGGLAADDRVHGPDQVALEARIVMYEHKHRRQPSVVAIAQMLSTMLYYKRFFPYYTFNVVCGVDDEGKGAVYHYDAIGSYERCPYTTSGSGSSLVMSVLDCQLGKLNQLQKGEPLNKQEVVEMCKDVLSSVGERDIFTGDAGEIFIIDAGGVSKAKFE